jgi:hypothetical protein
LFVDCNHTLFRSAKGLLRTDVWEANLEVVAAIERWLSQGEGRVVLWSERGAQDADMWRRRVMPQLEAIECLAKDAGLPAVGDVLIDDTAIAGRGVRYAPEQSFMVAPTR